MQNFCTEYLYKLKLYGINIKMNENTTFIILGISGAIFLISVGIGMYFDIKRRQEKSIKPTTRF